jgi:hypothetical protein
VTLDGEGGIAIKQTTSSMKKAGFASFEQRGIYLVSSTADN